MPGLHDVSHFHDFPKAHSTFSDEAHLSKKIERVADDAQFPCGALEAACAGDYAAFISTCLVASAAVKSRLHECKDVIFHRTLWWKGSL